MAELSESTTLHRFQFGDELAKDSAITGRIMSFSKITTTGTSPALSNALDPFFGHYDTNQLMQPLYSPELLCRFTTVCDVMAQCIKAMKVNIDGMGWQLEFVPTEDNPDAEPSASDKTERRRLQLLFDYPNARQSWVDIKMQLRGDKCLIGYCTLEVVRNLGDEIAELHYVAASTIRMTAQQETPTEHTQWMRDGDQWVKIIRMTRFRRFMQMVNQQRVWFKEFGDPRSLNKKTGDYAPAGSRWPFDDEATEIIFFTDDTQNSPYGEPPWVSELINIMGSSEAKKINYLYFGNKTIPPFIITVAGGTLGKGAEQKLKDYLDQEFKGSDNFHRVLLLEAQATPSGPVGDEKAPAVKIEVQPMTGFLQQDALFQEYIANNSKAVRQSFRLPPLLVGGAEEYSHASAMEAKIIAEQQVFQPERSALDEKINRTIIAAIGIQRWQMVSRGTPTSDDAQIITAMAAIPDVVPVGHAVDFVCGLMGKKPPKLDEATRSMLVGELRSKYAPQLMIDDQGQQDDQDSDNTKQPKVQVAKNKFISILKNLRDLVAGHRAA